MRGVGMRLAIAALGCLTAACASGPPEGPGGGPDGPGGRPGGPTQEARIARPVALLFVGMDVNHDLVLDGSALEASIKGEFTRADVDQNGQVTGFELAAWDKAVMGDSEALPDLRTMDPDFMNAVTLNEFTTALRREFERLDGDGDKHLTRAELLIDAPRMQGEPGAGGGQSGGPPRGGGGGRGPRGGGGGRPPG